jgi:hypothetical protein
MDNKKERRIQELKIEIDEIHTQMKNKFAEVNEILTKSEPIKE